MNNNIPVCPKFQKPTKRTKGFSCITSVYYPEIYDKNGVNINPDRNQTSTQWTCECGYSWSEKS